MDILELIPLLIFALLYLFGSSKKKREETKKKQEKMDTPHRNVPATEQKRRGLQERLEEALQQMEQRIEAESAAKKDHGRVEEIRMPVEELTIGPRAVDREVDADAVSNEIGQMVAATLYTNELLERSERDEELLDGGVIKAPGHSGFGVRLDDMRPAGEKGGGDDATGSRYDFRSLFEEVPNETYHGHGFSTFSEAHGLHFGERPDPLTMESSRSEEFHEAGGIHRKTSTSAEATAPTRSILHSPADLRRAIILAEILDRPVSQRRTPRRGL